jgi:hypothetical protein
MNLDDFGINFRIGSWSIPPPMNEKTTFSLKSYRSSCLWAIFGGVFGIALVLIVLISGFVSRRTLYTNPLVDPIVTVVKRTTTTLPVELTSTSAIVESELTPPPTPPAPPEGDFEYGQLVMVSGTGGDGLRLRRSPDLDAVVGFLGMENEVFRIIDGPVEGDGYIWWFLENPYESTKSGWAVANYLRSVDQP